MTSPYVVYGADESYFTGKLEAYFRAKGIAYRNEPFNEANMRRCAKHTGVVQIPQVECPDGSWLVDTTPIIAHFETTLSEPRLEPADPAARFVSLLIEDFGDEWLWRPAMHYRWSYPETARLMSGWLAQHLTGPVPFFVKKWFWRIRQQGIFVWRDGVNGRTRRAVEQTYRDMLDGLDAIFRKRPWVMGSHPVQADFGLFGSMFRHFSHDPTPARIMRSRAPAVYEWTARLWNASPAKFRGAPAIEAIPDGLAPVLALIARDYVPYLDANAKAHERGEKNVSYEAGGVTFTEPTKPYRVHCLDALGRELGALDARASDTVRRTLGDDTAFEILRRGPAGPVPPTPALPITEAAGTIVDSWGRPRKA